MFFYIKGVLLVSMEDIKESLNREFKLLWSMLDEKRQEVCFGKVREGEDIRNVIVGEVLDYEGVEGLSYRKVDEDWIGHNAERKVISRYDSLVEFVEYALYGELPTSILEDNYIGWCDGHLLPE